MVALLLGLGTLLVMMAALGLFSRAQIASIKAFGVWFLAIGGLALAALLFLTGRGGTAGARRRHDPRRGVRRSGSGDDG